MNFYQISIIESIAISVFFMGNFYIQNYKMAIDSTRNNLSHFCLLYIRVNIYLCVCVFCKKMSSVIDKMFAIICVDQTDKQRFDSINPFPLSSGKSRTCKK